ncbi:MAG: hypothetical protein LBP75_02125 [Planctomycetota bacterium]|jgi:hypothetical protein|nr:hypothetical protein [Planctomycetota bacterium]
MRRQWKLGAIFGIWAVLLTACGGNELLEQAQGGWLGEMTTTPPTLFSKPEPVKELIFVEVGENSIAVNGDKLDCEYQTSADGKTLKVFNTKERVKTLKEIGGELSAKEKEQVGLAAEISFNGDKLIFSSMKGKVECRRATKQDYETAVKNEQARLAAGSATGAEECDGAFGVKFGAAKSSVPNLGNEVERLVNGTIVYPFTPSEKNDLFDYYEVGIWQDKVVFIYGEDLTWNENIHASKWDKNLKDKVVDNLQKKYGKYNVWSVGQDLWENKHWQIEFKWGKAIRRKEKWNGILPEDAIKITYTDLDLKKQADAEHAQDKKVDAGFEGL